MPLVSHKLGQTFYQSRGGKQLKGLPIVCLHGGPGGHSRFMTDLFKLSNQRQVFIYDQIGGGRSSGIKTKKMRVSTFVQELEYLIDHWGLERFHLFGGSWGTTLALEYYLAKKNRQRVASLLFQSPMFSAADWQADANKLIRQLPAAEKKVIKYCHEIGATDSQVYKDAMKLYYSKHVCRNKARSQRASKIKNPNGNAVYEYMWGASEFSATGTLKDYDRISDLKHIACPTVFICGEHDEAQPNTARRYTKLVNGAQFFEVKDASHAILAEKPAQLIRLMRGFTQEVER